MIVEARRVARQAGGRLSGPDGLAAWLRALARRANLADDEEVYEPTTQGAETPDQASELPFALETDLERAICADAGWRAGAEWGEPRPGHPEGAVKHHIAEVLANVDRYSAAPAQRTRLRVIALTHDTFKHLVDIEQPRTGENHHGMIARRFTERFVTNDDGLLDIIELHDEAFNSHAKGARDGSWPKAEARAQRLLDRLSAELEDYLVFFRCDNETGSKSQDSLVWFEEFARR